MDSDSAERSLFLKKDPRILTSLLGSVYLFTGIIQIMVSVGMMVDPSGIIGTDTVSGFVLLVIAAVFFSGTMKSVEDLKESRSHLLVGVLLGILYGMSGFLIGISGLLSDLIGIEREGDMISDFMDPAVILFFVLAISLIMVMASRYGNRRGKHRQ